MKISDAQNYPVENMSLVYSSKTNDVYQAVFQTEKFGTFTRVDGQWLALSPEDTSLENLSIIDILPEDYKEVTELFDAAQKILLELSCFCGPLEQVRARIISFELEVLRIVGHSPTLLRCAECQTRIELTPRTAFAMLDGGTLCPKCRRGKRSVVSVSADALASLRVLAHSATAWQTIVLGDSVFTELRAIMSTYLAYVVGRRLKLAALLLSPSRGAVH